MSAPRKIQKVADVSLMSARLWTDLSRNHAPEPRETVPEWKGLRIYVKMTEHETSGPKLDSMRAKIAEKIGAEAAKKMIYAALSFEIVEIRPLADFGQGWEKSI